MRNRQAGRACIADDDDALVLLEDNLGGMRQQQPTTPRRGHELPAILMVVAERWTQLLGGTSAPRVRAAWPSLIRAPPEKLPVRRATTTSDGRVM